MDPWIDYGVEIRAELRGIDAGSSSRGLRNSGTGHKAPSPKGSQLSDRSAVSTHNDRAPGLDFTEHGGGLIAKLALGDCTTLHCDNCSTCSTL
jgi:hypothetical protein